MMKIFKFYTAVAIVLTAFAATDVQAQKKEPAKEQPKAVVEEAIGEVDETPVPAKMRQAKICVALPKTNFAPQETAAESLREWLVKYLSGPVAEIVSLDSMVAVQQQAEAAEKGCGYILNVSMMQKRKGGGEGLGGFLKNSVGAAPLLSDIGAGKTAQKVSTAASSSAAKMTTAGDLAITIKAKDEVTFDYALVNAGTQAIAASGKLKAKAGVRKARIF